jgi:hypothetical protein
MEQLFTATGEAKGSGQGRMEPSFTAGSEKGKWAGKTERDSALALTGF